MHYNYPQVQQMPGYINYKPGPQYTQWPQTAITNQQVRPVSSIEEVKASPIDFDGSIFYFTDVVNKKIYTKQINTDGSVLINTYELKTDHPTDSSFVSRKEFEDTMNKLYNYIKQKEEVQQVAAQPTQQKPLFEI